jgi:hypothetical protein
MRGITLSETHARAGQRIEIRRGNLPAAVEAHIGPAKIIGQNDDDVGLAGLSRRTGGVQRGQRNERESDKTGEDVGHVETGECIPIKGSGEVR